MLTNWLAQMRLKQLDVRLNGLRAKLVAVKEAVSLIKGQVPGWLVYDLIEIPKQIAEMEEVKKQVLLAVSRGT